MIKKIMRKSYGLYSSPDRNTIQTTVPRYFIQILADRAGIPLDDFVNQSRVEISLGAENKSELILTIKKVDHDILIEQKLDDIVDRALTMAEKLRMIKVPTND